jgi:hypothetical protein
MDHPSLIRDAIALKIIFIDLWQTCSKKNFTHSIMKATLNTAKKKLNYQMKFLTEKVCVKCKVK